MEPYLMWIRSTHLSLFVVNRTWVWPTCEILHFIGLVLLIGNVGLLDVRLLGFVKELPVRSLNPLLRWGVLGFVINLSTGVLFFVGNPAQYATNVAFYFKLLFIVLAGLNVVVFYVIGIARKIDALRPGEDAPASAKVIAALSLFLWFGVLYWGRMLPYIGNSF